MWPKLFFSNRLLFSAGALLGVTGVVFGAYGSHGLAVDAARLASWATAVQYQLIHALVLLVLGVWSLVRPGRLLLLAGGLLIAGVVLFSGSIYALVLTRLSWLGPVTPLGGLCLIAGWLVILLHSVRGDTP
ncbi:MAG: DUF423 domain-containing protein [Pseudomonadales bacterium]